MKLLDRLQSRIHSVTEDFQKYLISMGLEEPKPRAANYPFISGDSFMSFSDVALLRSSDKPLILRPYRFPEILFVEGELIETVINLDYALTFKAVIVHNADLPVSDEARKAFSDACTHLFATNVRSFGPYIHTLPIGIENLYLRNNGTMHYYYSCNENLNMVSQIKRIPVLVSFSPGSNHIERNRVLYICEKRGHRNILYKDLRKYRSALKEAMFVISPPGNGIDCHRTWEAIYHKAVPVVERPNYLYPKHIDLPIHVCESYDEFLSTDMTELILLYKQITTRTYPAVYSDWWFELIKKAIADVTLPS